VGEAIIAEMQTMERRHFGNTGLEVSAISVGCWMFGVDWWGHYSEERAFSLLNFSRDLGITYFDNGDAYGNGRAETIFGKWLKEHKIPRDQVEIGSKFGYDFYTDPGEAGSHRAAIYSQGARAIADAPWGRDDRPVHGSQHQAAAISR
jgi:aryl-alcohol dehydrogenase-like predicted oxidoreductase